MTDEKSEHSSTGTVPGYLVEAMHDASGAVNIGNQTFTREWQRVSFPDASIGVPRGRHYDAALFSMAGCHSYEAAQALRWWLHAEASVGMRAGFCLRSRIIKCKLEYSTKLTRESEHCEIGGEDRSNCMPDWGSKESSEDS